MNTPFCVITDAGREIMRGVNVSGNTVKSDPFVFTKIMLGCGTYTAEQKTESALRVMTALRTPKNNYPISSVKRVNASNNLYKVSAIATNYNVATETVLVADGYNVTEIGIYARAANSAEVLAAIAVIDEPDYMPSVNTEETIEGQIYQIVYDLYFGYSNVELDATIESSGAAYSAGDGAALEELIGPGTTASAVVIGRENSNSATKSCAVAMGFETSANGVAATAMGRGTQANGFSSTASGFMTVANGSYQSARGKWNVEERIGVNRYADIVGNGTSDEDRSNAYALTWDGDAHYALDTTAAADTDDGALYAATVALGWESEVIV
jgi:hypothetical protein